MFIGLVNIPKIALNAKIIRLVTNLQRQQLQGYEPNKELRKHYSNMRLLTENQMYDVSKYLEVTPGSEPPLRPEILNEYEQNRAENLDKCENNLSRRVTSAHISRSTLIIDFLETKEPFLLLHTCTN